MHLPKFWDMKPKRLAKLMFPLNNKRTLTQWILNYRVNKTAATAVAKMPSPPPSPERGRGRNSPKYSEQQGLEVICQITCQEAEGHDDTSTTPEEIDIPKEMQRTLYGEEIE